MTSLLALVMATCCFNFTLLCIDNQHFFLQHHAAILFLHLVIDGSARSFQPKLIVNLTSNVYPNPLFYSKAYLYHTEASKKRLDGSWVSSLFLNNRQHIPVCTKMISSWVSKDLSMAMAHLWIPSNVLQYLQLQWLVSPWCPSCREVTVPGHLLQLHTFFQHISLLQMSIRIPCSMLSWTLVSSQHVCKCQTLTYINVIGSLSHMKFCQQSTWVNTQLLYYQQEPGHSNLLLTHV